MREEANDNAPRTEYNEGEDDPLLVRHPKYVEHKEVSIELEDETSVTDLLGFVHYMNIMHSNYKRLARILLYVTYIVSVIICDVWIVLLTLKLNTYESWLYSIVNIPLYVLLLYGFITFSSHRLIDIFNYLCFYSGVILFFVRIDSDNSISFHYRYLLSYSPF